MSISVAEMRFDEMVTGFSIATMAKIVALPDFGAAMTGRIATPAGFAVAIKAGVASGVGLLPR